MWRLLQKGNLYGCRTTNITVLLKERNGLFWCNRPSLNQWDHKKQRYDFTSCRYWNLKCPGFPLFMYFFLGVVSGCMNFLKSSATIGGWNQGTVKIRVRHPKSLAQLFKVVFSGLGLRSHTNLLHVFITFNFRGVLVLYLHINNFINFFTYAIFNCCVIKAKSICSKIISNLYYLQRIVDKYYLYINVKHVGVFIVINYKMNYHVTFVLL